MAYSIKYNDLSSTKYVHLPKSDFLLVSSANITLQANKAGTLKFAIAPTHPLYDAAFKRAGIFDVYQDDEIIFSGFMTDITLDFYRNKSFICEGIMSLFNDTIQRPEVMTGTVSSILTKLLSAHNTQMAMRGTDDFKINKGSQDSTITAKSYTLTTNMTSTMKCLQTIQKEFGGYMQIRHNATNGLFYLDYLSEDSMAQSTQKATLGSNIIDINKETNYEDVATYIIPLGAKLASSTVKDERQTIKPYKSVDYISTGQQASTYNAIFKTVIFDDKTTAKDLYDAAVDYIADQYTPNLWIDAKAFDLSITEDIERFKLLDLVKVTSSYHDIDDYFPVTKMTIDILNPAKNTITFGKETKLKISEQIKEE